MRGNAAIAAEAAAELSLRAPGAMLARRRDRLLQAVPDSLVPTGRAARLRLQALAARAAAAVPARPPDDVVFIVGCPRSGTTILDRLLGSHPAVFAMNEPLHLWYAIEPRSDCNGFYTDEGRCGLDAPDATPAAVRRARNLFGHLAALHPGRLLVEKTPINAMRTGWLRALLPGARFIHLTRDGRDVVASIVGISEASRYAVAGRPAFHQWWGADFCKWSHFVRDELAAGRFPDLHDELRRIGPPQWAAMAAFEWLASNEALDRHLAARWPGAAPSILPVRYEDLLAAPGREVARILGWLGVETGPDRLASLAAMIRTPPARRRDLALPERLGRRFERALADLGYDAAGA